MQNLWGEYIGINDNGEIIASFQFCEGNLFLMIDSVSHTIVGESSIIIDSPENDDFGHYSQNDSCIVLYDAKNEELLILEILDSMNYLVTQSGYASLKEGNILRRLSSLFLMHDCNNIMVSLTHSRWYMTECKNSKGEDIWCCYYMNAPGNFFVSDYDTIIELPLSIYK